MAAAAAAVVQAPPAQAEGPLRRAVKERLLVEMLGSVSDPAGGGWKVLVLDALTTRVTSSALRMSDILDTGVSVVEDLDKRREPLPLPAVYFISPSAASVAQLCADYGGDRPLYPSAHVFFSGRAPPDAVERIKRCKPLLSALKSLKEVNLELTVVDGRTFVTDNPHAMIRCMGERAESSRAECEDELDCVAARLVTALACLHEYPSIRYRAGRPPEPGDAPGAAVRSQLAQRLAQKVSERAMALQRAGALPVRESCDLVVMDRSVDTVAPVVHEWTYEAMVYDLLPTEGNVIRYTSESAAGKAEQRDHALDESTDELWAELRHGHIADVYTELSRRFGEFQDRNKAAKYSAGRQGGSLSSANIRSLIQALPQFRDVLGRLSVHIFISSQLKEALDKRSLTELGELEQGLVYGERSSSDLVKYLADRGGQLALTDKMRLLMAYVATHPGKLDAAKAEQWARVARLDQQDMATVANLAFLGVAVAKQPGGGGGQTMGLSSLGLRPKKKKATLSRRRDGRQGEEQYTLGRFDPQLLGVVEDALAGRLPQDEYPHLRLPEEAEDFGAAPNEAVRVASARTNRSAMSWARRDIGGASVASASGPSGLQGALAGLSVGAAGSMVGRRRLIVFVLGGVTRGEMRAVHEASQRLGRDVLLGSTAVLRPGSFLSQLSAMGSAGAAAP